MRCFDGAAHFFMRKTYTKGRYKNEQQHRQILHQHWACYKNAQMGKRKQRRVAVNLLAWGGNNSLGNEKNYHSACSWENIWADIYNALYSPRQAFCKQNAGSYNNVSDVYQMEKWKWTHNWNYVKSSGLTICIIISWLLFTNFYNLHIDKRIISDIINVELKQFNSWFW